MAEQTGTGQRIKVRQMGQIPKENADYSDATMTALFNAHVAVINSERQVIWQRYAAMLFANSIVFGLLARASDPSQITVIGACLFGMLLCLFWWLLNEEGYKVFNTAMDIAQQFSWKYGDREINLIALQREQYEKGVKGGGIKKLSTWVIVLFVIGYAMLLVFFLCK